MEAKVLSGCALTVGLWTLKEELACRVQIPTVFVEFTLAQIALRKI